MENNLSDNIKVDQNKFEEDDSKEKQNVSKSEIQDEIGLESHKTSFKQVEVLDEFTALNVKSNE